MTATTPQAGRWLRALSPDDAAAIVARTEAAAAALPALAPGCRCLLRNMLFRQEVA